MMVLRLTRIRARPGQMPALREIYNGKILPEIMAMKGHHSSHLMEGVDNPDEALGWIVWDEPEFADTYVACGAFARQMGLIKHLLAGEPRIEAFNFI